MPARHLATGLIEHPPPDREDEPRLLGHRDEIGRGDESLAYAGVPSSQQCLEAGQSVRFERHDGLVMQPEKLGTFQCPSQLGLQLEPGDGPVRAHRHSRTPRTASGLPLRALAHVHRRRVGVAQAVLPAAGRHGPPIAIPMLTVVKISHCPPMRKGAASSLRIRSATRIASVGSLIPSRRIVNSSPPSRASVRSLPNNPTSDGIRGTQAPPRSGARMRTQSRVDPRSGGRDCR